MGFIYDKPLSIEQIFSMFNSNGGEKIDSEEVAKAKNVSIFEGFKVRENMTLQDFENENYEVYKKYEQLNSRAYAEQNKNSDIESWKEQAAKALEEIQEKQLEELDAMERRVMAQVDERNAFLAMPSKEIHVIGQDDPDGKQPKEGDYGVKDGKTFKFTKGEWKEVKANNSPKAPEVYNPENMPEGREGDFAVKDGDTYRFKNGQWVKIKTQ